MVHWHELHVILQLWNGMKTCSDLHRKVHMSGEGERGSVDSSDMYVADEVRKHLATVADDLNSLFSAVQMCNGMAK